MGAEIELTAVADLTRSGVPRERPARLALRGELVRVRRGVYVPAEAWSAALPAQRHLTRMHAAASVLGDATVFSHESAALALDLPLIGAIPTRPHVIVPVGGSKTSRRITRTQRALESHDVETAGGFTVTSAAVTAIDLAATRSLLGGIVAVSAARRRVPLAALWEVAGGVRAGVRRVRLAIEASTSLSESPLETLVLTRIRDLGFAEPEQQREMVVDGRRYRADFAWHDGGIILEADGRSKYTAASAEEAHAALWDEKLREDGLRGEVESFARTTWADAWDGMGLERKLLRAGVPRPRSPRPLTR